MPLSIINEETSPSLDAKSDTTVYPPLSDPPAPSSLELDLDEKENLSLHPAPCTAAAGPVCHSRDQPPTFLDNRPAAPAAAVFAPTLFSRLSNGSSHQAEVHAFWSHCVQEQARLLRPGLSFANDLDEECAEVMRVKEQWFGKKGKPKKERKGDGLRDGRGWRSGGLRK